MKMIDVSSIYTRKIVSDTEFLPRVSSSSTKAVGVKTGQNIFSIFSSPELKALMVSL